MRLLTFVLAAAMLAAQDSRNTITPDTDTHAKLPEFHSLEQWEARKAALRKQILSAAGLFPMPQHGTPAAEVFGRLERADYSIEKVLVETLPGYFLGGNLYRPLHRSGKLPAILNPHGHWTYGRLENSDNYSGPSLGINLAKQGYVVFAYDMVGYNDTVQTPHKFGSPVEQLWSFGPLQLQFWNSIRALDFIASLADVDTARLAITGASGGATQSFLLAAVDDRLRFAAPVNMVSALMQGGDFCENAPGLRIGTNNVEIAAMFAPKPMLLVSATGDWTKNVPHEEFPAIQRIYALYGKADNLEVIQIDAPHNFNKQSREGVYRFFAKRILARADAAELREQHVPAEMLQDMLALAGRAAPATVDVFKEWKALESGAEFSKERLRLALSAEWPQHVVAERTGEKIVLSRPGVGDRVAGKLLGGEGPALLVIGSKETAETVKQGRRVLVIDVFQTGDSLAPRNRSHEHFLTFNASDDACRVQDILTALAYLQGLQKEPVEIAASGSAAVWAEFAAAAAPVPVKLMAKLSGFGGRDEDFLRELNVPGIQRAGGLKALGAQ